MVYATSNPPQLLVAAIGNRPAIWSYRSADAKATVVGAAYITNAVPLGMKVGDFVLMWDTATPGGAHMIVTTLTGDAANLSYVANS